MRESEVFKDPSFYQECVLSGIFDYEDDQEIEKFNSLTENMLAIYSPERYERWLEIKRTPVEEEGLAGVVYKGEDSWEEILEEFRAFGLG